MPELPTLRGFGDELAGLPALGKAIRGLIGGGDYDEQEKLRKAILQDPSIAENLSQLNRDNPQLYGALKLGRFGDQIAQTPEGFKQKKEQQSLQAGELDIKSKQQEDALAPVRASILNAQKTKLDLDVADMQEAQKGFPGINWKKAVDDFSTGQQSSDLQAIMSNPRAMPLFQSMLGLKKQSDMLASQEDRADKRLQAQFDLQAQREDKNRTKSLIDQGKSFVLQSHVGTPETWAAYLDDPTVQAQAHDLVKNGFPKGHEHDQNLINLRDIAAKREQDQNLSGSIERTKVIGQVNNIFKDIGSKKYKKEELPGVISSLNQQLQLLQSLGGRSMQVVPESQLATGSTMDFLTQKKYSNKPVLIDAVTRQPLDENKLDVVAEQPSSPKFSPQQITQAAQDISKHKGTITWNDVIGKLKKEHPDMYQILKDRGDIPE